MLRRTGFRVVSDVCTYWLQDDGEAEHVLTHTYMGHRSIPKDLDTFQELAALAYRDVLSIDSLSIPREAGGRPWGTAPPHVERVPWEANHWMEIVHRLAWSQPETAKLSTRRKAWFDSGHLTIEYYPERWSHHLTEPATATALGLEQLPADPPWYSKLPYNVYIVSVLAIDLILDGDKGPKVTSSSSTTKPKSSGTRRPKVAKKAHDLRLLIDAAIAAAMWGATQKALADQGGCTARATSESATKTTWKASATPTTPT